MAIEARCKLDPRGPVWLVGNPIWPALGAILLAFVSISFAFAQTIEPAIPEPLRPWIPWVLEQGPEKGDRRACPWDLRSQGRICAWGGVLGLKLDEGGGRFIQDWLLLAPDWVWLPGDADHWPESVEDEDGPLPVVLRNGRPAVYLPPGQYRISGRFWWRDPPESLSLPPETALVRLVRAQGAPEGLRPDLQGRLWLQAPAQDGSGEGEGLELRVYRLIEDDLPLRVLTRLELAVSGPVREVRLGQVLLTGGIPLDLQGPLPARLGPEGALYIQVRPGRWVLEIASYHPGQVDRLTRPETGPPWPEQEVWAFVAHPERRRVEPSGLNRLDPSQSGVPGAWSRLPIYAAPSGASLMLVEQPRGDPEPDRLRLRRELWLDFDGRGLSIRDHLSGELNRSWRLEVKGGLELGQARVDGRPVLITRLKEGAPAGIEVRPGRLDLVADSRIEGDRNWVPASGWALALDGATARLNLPPGWEVIAAWGTDNRPETWLGRWTLLDLFLVLLIGLGIGRLWGLGWGVLALTALVLTWLQPAAPQMIWLHLLAAAALLRLLPEQPQTPGLRRWRTLVLWYQRLTLLVLLALGLPFVVTEIRNGFYPQLAWPVPAEAYALRPEVLGLEAPSEEGLSKEGPLRSDKSLGIPAPSSAPRPLERLDPKALIQTGPGVPDWQWRAIELSWMGPVGPETGARLWLLDPWGHLGRALLGSMLLVLLAIRLSGLDLRPLALAVRPAPRPGAVQSALILLAVGAIAFPQRSAATSFPPPELLEELRARLLKTPECLPQCLTLTRLEIDLKPTQLTLSLTLDAAVNLAAPVLDGRSGWSPSSLMLNGEPLDRLRRDDSGRLLIPLAPGRHQLRLIGPLGSQERIDLALGISPQRIEARAEGWRIEGLDPGGRPGSQFQLIRTDLGPTTERSLSQESLPPLLLVERRLMFGLDWQVETRVRRLSSPRFPVLLQIPLIPGESVQTPGISVVGGQAELALPPGQGELGWSSRLTPVDTLSLTASTDHRLTESWILDLSPIWHLEWMDLRPLHAQGAGSDWLTQWRPLPGERLTLRLSRPQGVPGPTLTFDRVDYRLEPSQRGTEVSLTLIARSTQGGSHRLRLPRASELRALSIDGRSLPLPEAQEGLIALPLVPGTQTIRLDWRLPKPIDLAFSPPPPDLGQGAVNINQHLHLPSDRWVLWVWGPGMGPAVLFWSLLIVLLLLALSFGRLRLTPLGRGEWLALGLGLLLAEVWATLVVAGWLFALGWRSRLDPTRLRWWQFNLVQLGLVVLSLVALSALIDAIRQGLLGYPEMWIQGQGSGPGLLNWYQDRSGPSLPTIGVLSLPLWVYRVLMLAWALWLAWRLIDWLHWGFSGLIRPTPWMERPRSDDLRLDGVGSAAAPGDLQQVGASVR